MKPIVRIDIPTDKPYCQHTHKRFNNCDFIMKGQKCYLEKLTEICLNKLFSVGWLLSNQKP